MPLILDELSECVANGNEAAQVTEAIALKDCLNHFLDELPTTKRWIFLQRHWYGDSIEEIARCVHKSENAICVTLSRLRTSLKDSLEKERIAL